MHPERLVQRVLGLNLLRLSFPHSQTEGRVTRRILITLTWLFGGMWLGFNAMVGWQIYLIWSANQ